MSTWTDAQHTDYAEKREEWYEANDRTWLCHGDGCARVVEYAPTSPDRHEGPCGHVAYCARCVRDHVLMYGDDGFSSAAEPCQWNLLLNCLTHPDRVACYLRGLGAQSYAAHVAGGTL